MHPPNDRDTPSTPSSTSAPKTMIDPTSTHADREPAGKLVSTNAGDMFVRVSQREIASRLGLSHSTVSLALRDHPHISSTTRRQVPQMGDDERQHLLAQIALRDQRIALLEQKLDVLMRRVFGAKSEALDPGQLELLLDPDAAKKSARRRSRRPRTGG